MKKVLIIYKYLPQYRLEFFELLKTKLKNHDVELQLIYGKSNKIDALKKDEVKIEWAQLIQNKEIKFRNKSLIWQPCLSQLNDNDLIITLPENKLILNYYLMFSKHFSKYKHAFWGHVYNMQNDLNNWRNKGKLFFSNKCDWWFAYTKSCKDFLINNNFPEDKITIVQNAIDTYKLKKYYSEINDLETNAIKEKLGINFNTVGIYCGAMYPDKDFAFILETCYKVKTEIPDFHMIFIGAGIESIKVEEAAKIFNWIHYVGPKFGREKVAYFKISSLQIMPRLVGLAIVDSFVLETPIITTDNLFHGPEIDYLENGINGVMTKDSLDDYSNAVIEMFKNEGYLKLIEGCKKSSEEYTVENMANNFKNGILFCLNIT